MPTRKRRQAGGGGNSYSFGGAVSHGAPYASEVVGGTSCMAAARPGTMGGYSPPGLGGLPGMAGGSRRRQRRGSKRRRRSQRGGRYMVAPAPYPASSSTGPNVYAPVTKLGCNFQGGGGADTVAYQAPTAGFSNQPSSWVGQAGAPVLVQAPYDAHSMNQACLKTGGGKGRGRRRGVYKSRRH